MLDYLGLAVTGLLIFTLAGAAQAVVGFGSALVAVPLLVLLMDPATAVVSVTVATVGLTADATWRERAEVDRPVATRITLAALVGMPAGLLLLNTASETQLSLLMVVVLLVAVFLVWLPLRLPSGRPVILGAGAVSGALLAATGLNGPPLVLALHALGLTPSRFRATLQATFCVQAVVAVIAFAVLGRIDAQVLVLSLSGLLGSSLGWRLGDRIFHRLSAEQFQRILITGLLVTTATIVVRVIGWV